MLPWLLWRWLWLHNQGSHFDDTAIQVRYLLGMATTCVACVGSHLHISLLLAGVQCQFVIDRVGGRVADWKHRISMGPVLDA